MTPPDHRRKMTRFEIVQALGAIASILLIPGVGLLWSIESRLITLQSEIRAAVVSLNTHQAQQDVRARSLTQMHLSAAPEPKCVAMHGTK